ncbi:unnamed protein product, partial [Ectocarpus sp. 13 AM-2016]
TPWPTKTDVVHVSLVSLAGLKRSKSSSHASKMISVLLVPPQRTPSQAYGSNSYSCPLGHGTPALLPSSAKVDRRHKRQGEMSCPHSSAQRMSASAAACHHRCPPLFSITITSPAVGAA